MAEFEEMNLNSADLVADRIAQLRELMPEVFAESGIDFDKLRLILGDEVDEGTERYAFTWPGKTDAIRQSQTPSMATLRPSFDESINWEETENLYIEGDNLEVLKLLQHSYHGRIKMIYIDPPYNTGGDFVYNDSFGDSIEAYKNQIAADSQSNADTSGRYHSKWCSMMYPRLRLARELLTDDGSLFISIDDNEVAKLRLMCDEIFGESNFICSFAWQKRYSPPPDTKEVGYMHETILLYRKSEHFEMGLLPFTEEQVARYQNPDNDPRGPWKTTDYTARYSADERPTLYYPILNPNTGEEIWPNRTRVWAFSKETHEKNVEENKLWWGAKGTNSVPALKNFLSDIKQGSMPTTLLMHKDVGHTDEAAKELKALIDGMKFTSKPSRLIRHLSVIANLQNGDIVLDFFSGTATTADAVMQYEADNDTRVHFIMVQLPERCNAKSEAKRLGYETVDQIGKERIRRAGAKIASEIEEANKQLRLGEEPKPIPDIGFRVLKLDESGIERPKPGELLLDVVKPDRSDEDIIFEMMLRWGLELTLPIEKVDAAGYPCYSVAYGELVCCLAPGLDMQVLDAIADMEPRRVLMLDRNLDDTTKLNAVQAFKRVEEKTGREVELRTV